MRANESDEQFHRLETVNSCDTLALPVTSTGAVWKAAKEVAPVFFLAGCGMVASGALLDLVTSSWQVFKDVPSLVILVPALLGLKGNLEMTLGARLGSHANKGDLEGSQFWPIISSNVMAVQCQAIIVGAAAAVLAIGEHYATTDDWNTPHALLLGSSAITAASVAAFVLSLLMIGIVVWASKIGIDPDNISAPIAGMLGDFCTLGIVSLVARLFWNLPPALFNLLPILLVAYAGIGVACGIGANRHENTQEIMKYGWYPVLASMLLSNLSGPVSEYSIKQFTSFARFQVVMNGAGGNLGSILASKMSTNLGMTRSDLESKTKQPALCRLRTISTTFSRRLSTACRTREDAAHMKETSHTKDAAHMNVRTSWCDVQSHDSVQVHMKHFITVSVLFGNGEMVRFARLLLFLTIPGQTMFACVVVGVASGWTALPTPLFLASFVAASLCQVILLFLGARTFVVVCWRKKIDPDNAASPLVCGLGDLLGTSLMMLAYMFVRWCGGETWAGGGL